MPQTAWTVERSRTLLRDRWMGLRADDCRTASGIVVAPYYVLEFPDFVNVLALDARDRVLLVRQYRHAYGGPASNCPAA